MKWLSKMKKMVENISRVISNVMKNNGEENENQLM